MVRYVLASGSSVPANQPRHSPSGPLCSIGAPVEATAASEAVLVQFQPHALVETRVVPWSSTRHAQVLYLVIAIRLLGSRPTARGSASLLDKGHPNPGRGVALLGERGPREAAEQSDCRCHHKEQPQRAHDCSPFHARAGFASGSARLRRPRYTGRASHSLPLTWKGAVWLPRSARGGGHEERQTAEAARCGYSAGTSTRRGQAGRPADGTEQRG